MKGGEVLVSSFKGSMHCIVNFASNWCLTNGEYNIWCTVQVNALGYTYTSDTNKISHIASLTKLTELYNKYSEQVLKILIFPCNQFGGQETLSLCNYHSCVMLYASIINQFWHTSCDISWLGNKWWNSWVQKEIWSPWEVYPLWKGICQLKVHLQYLFFPKANDSREWWKHGYQVEFCHIPC